jgi:flagellar motor protein MotB
MPAPEQQPVLQDSPATAAIVPETPLASTPVPAASGTAGVPATGLRIPGATVTLSGDGAWLVRYDAAVFVSADKISVEGMKALKATAAALLKLADGATITIYGHTDDIPPPPDALGPFRTNADLANARAKVVQDHLTVFCKRQSRYAFEMAAPGTVPAPYPNDTDAHRRLNRTVTLRIVPTGHTAD